MKLIQSLSGKVTLFIFAVFVISFIPKFSDIASGEDKCLCGYDGYGYYLYLPHFFEKGDLNITQEWAQQLQDEYCGGLYVYQVKRTEAGKELNLYHMGLAFVELPSYFVGDVFARILGYKTDGFSTPYYITFVLNTLLFIFLGLLYLRKLLLLYLNEKTSAIVLVILFVASNIYPTFLYQHDLQHLYLFALNAIFLYHLFQFSRTQLNKHLVWSAIILGLTVAIRPTEVLLGIFPLIVLLKMYGIRWNFFSRIWIYPFFGLIWNLPQIAYWWFIGGELFVPNLHNEDLILSDPNIINFLFSYKKGWLLYSPVFFIALHGLYVLFKHYKELFWASLIFFPMYIWVMSSWECWWYAQSYGSRVMIDVYPMLAILIGLSISTWKNLWTKIIGYGFVIACSLLTMIQIHQAFVGYLSYSDMTKQHYWYIFGRLNIDNYTGKHLEKNRFVVDPNWIKEAKKLPKTDYSYHETLIYELPKPTKLETGGQYLLDMTVLDELPSDEGMVEIELVAKTADSTKSVIIQVETFSEYDWYSWLSSEVSIGHSSSEFEKQTHYFNLQHIRHREDKMQFYFYSAEQVPFEIESLTIKAHTITRK